MKGQTGTDQPMAILQALQHKWIISGVLMLEDAGEAEVEQAETL